MDAVAVAGAAVLVTVSAVSVTVGAKIVLVGAVKVVVAAVEVTGGAVILYIIQLALFIFVCIEGFYIVKEVTSRCFGGD